MYLSARARRNWAPAMLAALARLLCRQGPTGRSAKASTGRDTALVEADEPSIPSPEKLATYFLTLLKLFDLKKCLQDIHELQVLLIDLNRSRLFTEKLINKS